MAFVTRIDARSLFALTTVFVVAYTAHAQSYDVDLVQSVRDTTAHEKPDAASPTLFSAAMGTGMVWAEHMDSNGWYRVVRKDKGPVGWIDSNDLRITHEHEHGSNTADPDAQVCAQTLAQCPARGCAKESSWEAEANALKRARPQPGNPIALTFDDLEALQREADGRVGQGPYDITPEGYRKLKELRVSAATVAEGDLVRVVGYIPQGQDGLHVNQAGESVNCNLKKPADNDIHIPVAAAAGDTEFQAIVVEMIPQDRPTAWTIDALKAVRDRGAQVRVEGSLSYDKVHYVSNDPSHPFKNEPDRMSLWEIHPITDFRVCNKESCDPARAEDWSPLAGDATAAN